MDVGSALDLAFANWIFFATVVVIRLFASQEGFRSFRLSLRPATLLLYAEGAAAAVGSWFIRGLFMVLSGHGSVALQAPGRDFWLALGGAVLGYLPVALFEECLFRGYLQDHFAKKWGVTFAIVAQAIPFGMLHVLTWDSFPGEWIKVAMVAVFGLALGTAARNGRSLMWGVGFHHWWNVSETLIKGPFSPVVVTTASTLTGTMFSRWVGLGAAVVVLGCTRLRFLGALPADELAETGVADGVPSAVPGNPIMEAMPENAMKGAPSLDPDLTAS